MFLILQDESFNVKKKGPKRKFKEGNTRYILGTKIRSKTGCLTCRKKKRKCDERFPECDYCKDKGLHCSYLDNKIDRDLKKKEEELPSVVPRELSTNPDFIQPRDNDKIEADLKPKDFNDPQFIPMNYEPEIFTPKTRTITEVKSITEIIEGQESDQEAEEVPLDEDSVLDLTSIPDRDSIISMSPAGLDFDFINYFINPSPMTVEPTSFPSLYLDSQGLEAMDYYKSKVAIVLSISPDSSNHFIKSFFDLAMNEESFMYAIAAWGSVYRGRGEEAKSYLNKAITRFNKTFVSNDDNNLYFKLSFKSILTTYHICLGNDDLWFDSFLQMCQMIKEHGGLVEVCRKFHYSNGIRFIISLLQYNDILNSKGHKYGTVFKSLEYQELMFNTPFKDNELNYGVDTLQGILQTMLIKFHQIIELKLKINKFYQLLEEIKDVENYNSLRNIYFKEINEEIDSLHKRIIECQPDENLLRLMDPELEQYELSLLTFKSYKNICCLYFNLYVKKLTPDNIDNQVLVQNLFGIIDIFSKTRFCVISCLPLILCGICCVNKFDREILKQKIMKTQMTSPVQNSEKAWIVIQKCWELNPKGDKTVDWADICENFGFSLNVC